MLKTLTLLSGRGAGHQTQAWLTEALPLTKTSATLCRCNRIRVRPVMPSVQSVTHLRSRCLLHSSAFAEGSSLLAAWGLQVMSWPSSFLPVHGVSTLSQVCRVTEKSAEWPQPVFLFPAIAWECLAGPCSPAG